jgi:hypothetical protein
MRRFIVAGSALATVLIFSAGGQARTATAISIKAKTSVKPFEHMVLDVYGKPATISGTVANGQAGAAVQLQGSTFPYSSGFGVLAQSTTVAGGAYSFQTKPVLATRYRVVLVAEPTSVSPVITVYLTPPFLNATRGRCPLAPRCRRHFAADIVYPPSVAPKEIGKRAYLYFGIRYGSGSIPPKRLRLIGTGRQKHVGGSRYRMGFTISFATPAARGYRYQWTVCLKDTEAKDGLGLPGHHHCGARFLRYSWVEYGYVG